MAQTHHDTPQTPPASHLLDLPSSSSDDVALLARLIYSLQQALVPVSPSEPFRTSLRRDLVIAAHERQALAAKRSRRQLTNPWAWLAASIASTVSVVVGIVTYVIWHRIRTVAN